MGRDSQVMGASVLLAPCVNIQRVPLAGRNFETYSEDPFLSGTLGVGFVKGLQSEGVGASVKHFVGNEQELERFRGSSNIDERTLREIYLRPFEMIVKEANPWTAMAAYNRVNGTYMTENEYLLSDVLKKEWGFDGLVMSDWGAVHGTLDPVPAGLDLEMPGPPKYFGDQLLEAVENWQVEVEDIDEAVRRVIRLLVRTGALDPDFEPVSPYSPRKLVPSERNREIARQAAEEGIVLLKNDNGLLPLKIDELRSIAVIGPNAEVALVGGGGSSQVTPSRPVTPLESLRAKISGKVEILHSKGTDNDRLAPVVKPEVLSIDPDRAEQGLKASYYVGTEFEGQSVMTETDTWFDKKGFGGAVIMRNPGAGMSVRWEGYFWPPVDGEYEFQITGAGNSRLALDGKSILGTDGDESSTAGLFLPLAEEPHGNVTLEAGQPVKVLLEYVRAPSDHPFFYFRVRLPEPSIQDAVDVARRADVAVVFIGASESSESEGFDRATLSLFGKQDELVEAVADANPKTVVVLQTGGPVAMPWNEKVTSILQAWFPGEEGSNALTKILLGEANPSGKLPVTFPARIEDSPTYILYGPGRDANYGEGVFVGYRFYDKKDVAPLYPFGHGLSYTTFQYSGLSLPEQSTVGSSIIVNVKVANTGKIPGGEVVQLYVGDEGERGVLRPVRELKAFQKVHLDPGESKMVEFELTARDFAYYDIHKKKWVAEPGRYIVSVGSSSRDIRLSESVSLSDN